VLLGSSTGSERSSWANRLRWALRRNFTVHGLSDPMDYFRMAPELLARRY